ncbi:hypothetical protein BSL78_28558 [Apostichopus japonicus]|uniref:Hyalin n=1 Tax=Stichopus japonicus TaxID=307972 RepID=A0A2G8JFV4_STIJA|nr:hypothetical protein BSL78_28558 [Apostichopus japonicus]
MAFQDEQPPNFEGVPPVIACVGLDVAETIPLNGFGTTVQFREPTATDNSGTASVQSRTHSPGQFFQSGTTQVTYVFIDPSGNTAECSFNIIITEAVNTPPSPPTCPNIEPVTSLQGDFGQFVTWDIGSCLDSEDGSISPVCDQPSGDLFPVGQTTNHCTCTDSDGATSECEFNISVNAAQNACANSPCQNGGACTSLANNNFVCQCPTGFTEPLAHKPRMPVPTIPVRMVAHVPALQITTFSVSVQLDLLEPLAHKPRMPVPTIPVRMVAHVPALQITTFSVSVQLDLLEPLAHKPRMPVPTIPVRMVAHVPALQITTFSVSVQLDLLEPLAHKPRMPVPTIPVRMVAHVPALQITTFSVSVQLDLLEPLAHNFALNVFTLKPCHSNLQICIHLRLIILPLLAQNACANNPCQNGGACTSLANNNFFCQCPTGFTGTTCTQTQNACANNPCQNGGTCTSLANNNFFCQCPTGFTGTTCTQTQNACANSPCQNGGACTSLANNNFVCQCPTGFTGTTCTQILP